MYFIHAYITQCALVYLSISNQLIVQLSIDFNAQHIVIRLIDDDQSLLSPA